MYNRLGSVVRSRSAEADMMKRIVLKLISLCSNKIRSPMKQERPAVADKPARRLRKVCTVYVRAVRL